MPTRAYTDLMFAFGHATLGDADVARALLARAERTLTQVMQASQDRTVDAVHSHLLSGFRFRIDEAIAGRPHRDSFAPGWGTLPETADSLAPRYAVDVMRLASRILDPEEPPDPYNFAFQGAPGRPERVLGELSSLGGAEFAARVSEILHSETTAALSPQFRALFLSKALPLAPRAGTVFAEELLGEVERMLALTDNDRRDYLRRHQAEAVAQAFILASRLDRSDWAARLVAPFLAWAESESRRPGRSWPMSFLASAVEECVRALIRQGQHDTLRTVIFALEPVYAYAQPPDCLLWQTPLAGGWLALDEPGRAAPLLQAAEQWLTNSKEPPRRTRAAWYLDLCRLFRQYLCATAYGPFDMAAGRFEQMFGTVRPFPSTRTTARYFAQMHLEVTDVAVRCVAGPEGRPPTAGDLPARRAFLTRLRDVFAATGWDNPR